MVKNYFLYVFVGIIPFGLLASLHTARGHRSPNQFAMTDLRI